MDGSGSKQTICLVGFLMGEAYGREMVNHEVAKMCMDLRTLRDDPAKKEGRSGGGGWS